MGEYQTGQEVVVGICRPADAILYKSLVPYHQSTLGRQNLARDMPCYQLSDAEDDRSNVRNISLVWIKIQGLGWAITLLSHRGNFSTGVQNGFILDFERQFIYKKVE